MKKIATWISKHNVLIVIISIVLLIPSIYGFIKTRTNYDILVYLPDSVDTIKGEKILTNDFKLGSYAFVITNANSNNILNLENKIKNIDGVNEVVSVADITDLSIPIDMLPSEIKEKLIRDNETIIMVTFNGTASEDKTIESVRNLREVVDDASKVSSMTSMVIDTMDLSNNEIIAYVLIAVLFCLIVLTITTDSYLIPFLLLANIGIAILYNMGSNIIFGEISYITKAISAVLQLGVTTDFSIFLYHTYEEEKKINSNKKEAMANAINATFKSIIGSSLTTFAGFLALCTMNLTLGKDIGLVMAKGIVWGLVCVLTLFPSLLLLFDKYIAKTKHKVIMPKFNKLSTWIVKHNYIILIIFLVLLIPAYIGNKNYQVYYKLDESLPKDLPFNVANTELANKFGITSPEMILIEKDLKANDINNLVNELKKVEGIDLVLAPNTIASGGIINILPNNLESILNNDKYQLIIANSTYEIASDDFNNQVDVVSDIVKNYDDKAIIAGEGALMKNLVEIADHDFKMVNYTSIIVIFVIMIFVLKSISLPTILVVLIEFAIFCNMAITYYTKTPLPFIASIVVGTIQLGATIDYAILMSTKYKEERKNKAKKEAMEDTLKFTIPSIITSALCFFAATISVAIYTKIDMIGSICKLLARGSLISMVAVILILPCMLMLLDKLLIKKEGNKMNKKIIIAGIFASIILPMNVSALEKNETVYTNLNKDGSVAKEVVNTHLYLNGNSNVEDVTELENILNISGNEEFTLKNNKLTWQSNYKDILYEGTSKKENPLKFNITYYYNDELIDENELIGKEGNVKVQIKINNSSTTYRNYKKYYTPFVVMLGTTLNSANNHDIKISSGKVVNTGTKNIVIGLASPGLYENTKINEFKDIDTITITYYTVKYESHDLYFVASPKLLDEIDLNKFNIFDELGNKTELLDSSINKLQNGAKTIEENMNLLNNGNKELTNNLKNIVEAINKIETGSKTIDNGLNEIVSSLEKANISVNDMTENVKKLHSLKEGNNKAINKLTTANSNLKAKYDAYKLENYTISELQTNLGLLNYDENTINSLILVKETYEGNNELIYLLNLNNTSIDTTLSALTNINEGLSSLTTLTDVLTKIKAGTNSLSSNLTNLKNGLTKLYQASSLISDGSNQLYEGTKDLSNGITTFKIEGIDKIITEFNKVNNYSKTIKDLSNISKEYSGYGANNVNNTTFIYKVER